MTHNPIQLKPFDESKCRAAVTAMLSEQLKETATLTELKWHSENIVSMIRTHWHASVTSRSVEVPQAAPALERSIHRD